LNDPDLQKKRKVHWKLVSPEQRIKLIRAVSLPHSTHHLPLLQDPGPVTLPTKNICRKWQLGTKLPTT
jgi:hypothetical protein